MQQQMGLARTILRDVVRAGVLCWAVHRCSARPSLAALGSMKASMTSGTVERWSAAQTLLSCTG